MLIFLYGPDDYRRFQKRSEIIFEFMKRRSSLGIQAFDFESKDEIAQFEEFGNNQSIFGNAKLAVISNAFEAEAKALAKILAPFAGRKDINVLISEREKPVKALGFLIEEPTFFQKFESLEGVPWISFIAMESKKFGLALDAAALQFLATVHQDNSWALVTELQKISGLKPQGGLISRSDLDTLNLEASPNYWGLLNGLKSQDQTMRLTTLEKMLALNDPPAKIFNILASQLQEKIPQIAEYDFAIKSGKMEYEEALLELLIG